MNAKLRSLLLGSLGLLFALAVWEVMGRRLGDGLVAPPSRVVIDLFAFLRDQAALDAIFSSIIPMLVGFALSCIVGMPAGVAMGIGGAAVIPMVPYPGGVARGAAVGRGPG